MATMDDLTVFFLGGSWNGRSLPTRNDRDAEWAGVIHMKECPDPLTRLSPNEHEVYAAGLPQWVAERYRLANYSSDWAVYEVTP